MNIKKELYRGIVTENPLFRIALGMCPSLATSTSATNALGMGLSVIAVLTCSNTVISLLRRQIPDKVRIPAFIVIIATFVTMVDLLIAAFVPTLYDALGIFIPLIVVNCIILGRAEAYAAKNEVLPSTVDGVVMGVGFALALTLVGSLREFFSAGTLFGFAIAPFKYQFILMILAPGAFITLGLVLAFINYMQNKEA
ncbi:MAG: electron transport complex subunit RsxE [Candidatus Wallbacteria bacterium GWC2_49_35]|uniref:Ion-translocating oxidoreductase complex subunit E n=1 Tax=Candidatus Wallbacteria bacterium GWC2_49_35 TaxID=1817813 RepID=A0A1F7WTN4_9BACT|nr:MAG: electron transport complex subunit RsxE [Candidatus Wallbacteria bacterium GWC2_49_35]